MHEVTALLVANDGTFKSDGIFQSDGTPRFDALCAMFSNYFVIDYRLQYFSLHLRQATPY